MVFSDADPTFSISSILTRFDPSVSSAAGANTTQASRPVPSRTNSDRKPTTVAQPNGAPASKTTAITTTTTTTTTTTNTLSRPSVPGASKPAATTTNSSSRISTTSAVTSSKTDAGAIAKKRKIEESAQSVMEKQRAALLAKAKKATSTIAPNTNKPMPSKISTVGTRPGTTSVGNTPTEAPKKVGYMEALARAAQTQAEKKAAPGTITHKVRPQIKEKRAWQKKLEEQKAGKSGGATGAERSSKSPGIVSGGEKGSAAGKKMAEPIKAVAGKKGVGGAAVGGVDGRRPSLGNIGATTTKGKSVDRVGRGGSAADIGIKRKRESPPRGGYGGSGGRAGGGYSLPRKNTSRRYGYDDDEEDDFVVDDDDDLPARGKSYGGGGGKNYVYYDSDDDSGSDMEAAGIDVLEEEERSGRAAVLEDQAQERLEKEMAAKKAALKKKLAVKKK